MSTFFDDATEVAFQIFRAYGYDVSSSSESTSVFSPRGYKKAIPITYESLLEDSKFQLFQLLQHMNGVSKKLGYDSTVDFIFDNRDEAKFATTYFYSLSELKEFQTGFAMILENINSMDVILFKQMIRVYISVYCILITIFHNMVFNLGYRTIPEYFEKTLPPVVAKSIDFKRGFEVYIRFILEFYAFV